MTEAELREAIAAKVARIAPDAFSSTHAKSVECNVDFPADFSASEAAHFRTLAAHIVDVIRPELQQK